jgi:two-component system, OmpR family, copper resistance phosphate regulon response regulator CusR
MKILLIEDEKKVASFIKKGLEAQGFEVDVGYDGSVGKKLALHNIYSIILLDVNLPLINGIEVCKILRKEDVHTPILMLTALDSINDKIEGFDAGADDYLAKPFEFRELIARIRALTKRNTESPKSGHVLKIADLEINLDEKTVRRATHRIDLTAKEYALLEYLLLNKGRIVSRVDIAEKVWDLNFDTGTNVIDVYINFLRKKIDKDYPLKLIHTVVGMGYVLRED